MRFGVLLPHFGHDADPDGMIAYARRAEALGFDSLWVRDHVSYASDGTPTSFFEALTSLTAVGAQTDRIRLGTAALVPFRSPVMLARILSTMRTFFPGRLEIGLGAGSGGAEFSAVGVDPRTRSPLMQETARILRRFNSEATVAWEGELVTFDTVAVAPADEATAPRFWWCGPSPLAARLGGGVCDGWLPGRITLATFDERVTMVRAEAEKAGRGQPSIGIMPRTALGTSREDASRRLDLPALLEQANGARFFVRPQRGEFVDLDDLEGMVLYGTVDDIAAQCDVLRDHGAELVVFDTRASFEHWESQLEGLAAVQARMAA